MCVVHTERMRQRLYLLKKSEYTGEHRLFLEAGRCFAQLTQHLFSLLKMFRFVSTFPEK